MPIISISLLTRSKTWPVVNAIINIQLWQLNIYDLNHLCINFIFFNINGCMTKVKYMMIIPPHITNIPFTPLPNIMVRKSCVKLFKVFKHQHQTINQWDTLKLVVVIEIPFITILCSYNVNPLNVYGLILENYFLKNTAK